MNLERATRREPVTCSVQRRSALSPGVHRPVVILWSDSAIIRPLTAVPVENTVRFASIGSCTFFDSLDSWRRSSSRSSTRSAFSCAPAHRCTWRAHPSRCFALGNLRSSGVLWRARVAWDGRSGKTRGTRAPRRRSASRRSQYAAHQCRHHWPPDLSSAIARQDARIRRSRRAELAATPPPTDLFNRHHYPVPKWIME